MNTQPEPMGTPSPQPWLLRLGEVRENTGLCKSQLYRLMAAGEFPKTGQDRTANSPMD